MKTLLSIDGGGLFGVGVANWLPKLAGNWKFDCYAGTSVGSILAACYATGMSPAEVQKLFNSDLPKKMFTKEGGVKGLAGLANYTTKGARDALASVFGDMKVSEVKHPLVIVAWNYNMNKEKVFSQSSNSSYLLRDAVLASISAPTYFRPLKLKNEEGKEEQLGDGGVCGNDPSLAGITEMLKKQKVDIKDIKCLSIGTTGEPREKKIKISTIKDWIPILTDVITLGNVAYTSYCVRHILGNRYLKVSPDALPRGSMDNFKLVPKIKEAWEKHPEKEALNFLRK
ncbi:MAG: patatin-like phospholipase family protein [Fibromonadaceae bacterium]|nr:patatin-like phospholipase family protein [Fibromonadaceae bacterium]